MPVEAHKKVTFVIQRSSGLLLPDMTNPIMQCIGRTGEMPPIAGAASSWKLPTTSVTKRIGAANLTERSFSYKINLLKFDSPTIMTEWLITDLRIPCLAYVHILEPKGALRLVYGVNLYLGGDIVWSSSEKATYEKVTSETFVPSVFASNLTQPISFSRGRTLELEIYGLISFEGESPTSEFTLGIGYTTAVNPSNLNEVIPTPSEGAISYYIDKLSGHRTF